MSKSNDKIIMGQFGAPYGVQGWLKVTSYTDPIDNLLNYDNWWVQHNNKWQRIIIEAGRRQGDHIVVKIQGYDDRDKVRYFTNDKIGVDKNDLPQLENGEYYWSDLEGLTVETIDAIKLGQVDHMMEGANNDIFVVTNEDQKEHLIPYTKHIVKQIDINNKKIIVDWDPDF